MSPAPSRYLRLAGRPFVPTHRAHEQRPLLIGIRLGALWTGWQCAAFIGHRIIVRATACSDRVVTGDSAGCPTRLTGTGRSPIVCPRLLASGWTFTQSAPGSHESSTPESLATEARYPVDLTGPGPKGGSSRSAARSFGLRSTNLPKDLVIYPLRLILVRQRDRLHRIRRSTQCMRTHVSDGRSLGYRPRRRGTGGVVAALRPSPRSSASRSPRRYYHVLRCRREYARSRPEYHSAPIDQLPNSGTTRSAQTSAQRATVRRSESLRA